MKYGSHEQVNGLVEDLKQSAEEFQATQFGRCVPVVVGAELRTHKLQIGRLENGKLQLDDGDVIDLTWNRNFSYNGTRERIFINLETVLDRVGSGRIMRIGVQVVLQIREIDMGEREEKENRKK
jgi:pyruvate kinase